MALNYVAAKVTRLSSALTSTDTSIVVAELSDRAGNTLTMSDFGDIGFAVIDQGGSNEEHISFTGISSTTLTGVTRGLAMKTPYTNVSANQKAHASGVRIIISNLPAFYNRFSEKSNNETITGTWTFTDPNIPRMDSYSAPTDDESFATKKYVDDTATGTTNVDKLVVSGIAGETVAAGECVYFSESDNEWRLADASTGATCDDVMLGLARGAGTNGNAISGGVLLYGRDDNQSGFAQGDAIYISDTAGTLANSAGTVEVAVGYAYDADSIDFNPNRWKTSLTTLQKALVAGITASSAEINNLDGYTGSTALLNESATFFGATDMSGAEAETLTDGSNADSLHIHSYRDMYEQAKTMLGADIRATMGGLGDGMTEVATGGTVTRTIANTRFYVAGAGHDAGINAALANDDGIGGATDYVQFADNPNCSLVGDLLFYQASNQDFFFGFYSGALAAAPANATDVTAHVAFMIDDATIYASTADGATQDRTDVSSGITLTDMNTFEIAYTGGSQALFYINGSLVATLNTNLPSAAATVHFNSILTYVAGAATTALLRHPYCAKITNLSV